MAKERRKATEAANKRETTNVVKYTTAKVADTTNIAKVYDYFRYTVGTTLDCAKATGILRNCITWYVRDLERLGLLQAIFKAKDKHTQYKAKYYSADHLLWVKPDVNKQLKLYGEAGLWEQTL